MLLASLKSLLISGKSQAFVNLEQCDRELALEPQQGGVGRSGTLQLPLWELPVGSLDKQR